MSWEYFLVPVPDGSRFSDEALLAMHAYVRALPSWQRSDGVYCVAESFNTRDNLLARGSRDERWTSIQHIKLAADQVTLGVWALDPINLMFAEFMRWCMSQWPCEALDQSNVRVTVDEFLARQQQVNANSGF
jgi:hypothetical protein